ncbi:leukemia inhibitory factor receptor [Thamnophis elegans]|uniref:leukemia inhibitory factor receptor n=1 Tax=Thamnophis elegans TaxID=35005 RepID=UPI001377F26B|nr:leukemia inhibitory factor receptor [Thamnophis elegans]XP_032068965.1 leukemia inhibitory factor receptor [Thamnophis elegans]XP_032068966.1 leukemia inhibitory factor receptor [Thamnophis elegans]
MWINQIPCYLLMVAHLFILNRFVYSQEKGSSYSAQNLTCITHNLDNVVCTWTTDTGDDSKLTYEFCYNASSAKQCSLTKEKKGTFQLIVFDLMHIEITTFNSAEEGKNPLAKNKFVLPEKDILFVPQMPQIHGVARDYIADTAILEWYDGGSVFQYQIDSSWQIQILRKDPMEEVALETYNTSVGNKDTLRRWEWTSDLPFNCTIHYFRIRCFLNEKTFAGRKMWSEWSPLVNVTGSPPNKIPKMYPIDKVVAVGSNVTFCCVYQDGYTLLEINYASCTTLKCEVAPLTNWSMTISVQNVISDNSSNVNGWCQVQNKDTKKKSFTGTVLFVGYPPGVPQNLTCETQNFKEIGCHWQEKRPTLFCGPRRTYYALFEGNSGKNMSCAFDRLHCKHYRCNFTLLKDQTEYNFTLHASSHLGQAEASLLIDIRHRVYPHKPTDLKVSSVTSDSFRLSFSLPGNFKETKLQCQVQMSNGASKEERIVLLDNSENSHYIILVDKLHPFTKYDFQVRCATPKPFFWKWSEWSTKKTSTTQQAQPARELDIWREKDANEDTVTLFWKPLPLFESNGLIETYEVYWTLPDKSTKNESVPASHNSTKINIGKNDCIFTVKAKNKAGVSPPSSINSAELPAGDISIEKGIGKDNSISLAWHPDSNVTCGYVVRWCYGPEPCTDVNWEKFSSSVTNADIKSDVFQPGVRYTFSVFGCKENGYQILGYIKGYIQELSPKTAPDFSVQHTTSDSIVIKWKNISVEDSRGFLQGYLLKCAKGEKDGPMPKYFKPEINVTDLNQDVLTVSGLQGKTSYHLTFEAYTAAGSGPVSTLNVVTKENSLGLIIAIIIPVSVVLVLAVVTGILCYRKREWIKEVFYPDIPNPEHSKALDFPRDSEGNPNSKTLEMNPCTPNNIEVVETQSQGLKIEDTAITSSVEEDPPEDGLESESGSHIVVSYCPPIIEEVISNPPEDESAVSSQVVYIDVQSMYSAPVKPNEELEADCVVSAGYKPQMQLAVNSFRQLEETSATEEDSDKGAGYRPQANAPSWNTGGPDSPDSTDNVSFGSPCSINSRQFLIPPKDEDDESPKAINSGWSFANLFHTKSNE